MGSEVHGISPVSGGDIASAFLLKTTEEQFFVKMLLKPEALNMFQVEKAGLDAIRNSNTVRTPEVYFCEAIENGAFLLMEYVESKKPTDNELALLGKQLAELHQSEASLFGWDRDNYIGSLPQSNTQHPNWAQFYVRERLIPQLDLARKRGLLSSSEIPAERVMEEVLVDLSAVVRPSLLHGDLWSGNYLISSAGIPYLIDPAVYFGHNEVDIAMSRLFGGFGNSFYKAYENVYPGDTYSNDRINIYQLYYLLVHLNLFGHSYYSGVISIMKRYFK